jgi:hypothetical protein
MKPVETVRQFMESIWNEPPKPNTVKQIYRGQASRSELLPKLFRDRQREPKALKELGDRLLADFQARSPYLLPSIPYYQFDWLSLAQHYGLPTCLLDWTANSLMALFFALDDPAPRRPTVWVYSVTQEQLHGRVVENINIVQPGRHSHRVAVQAGWHTVHHLEGLDDDLQIRPLSQMAFHSERLTEVSIHRDKANSIRGELKEMGIDHVTVYADLTSVCRAIQDELKIPPSMRLQSKFWGERQERYQAHILAHLLANGLPLKIGDPFTWMGEPDEDGNAVGGHSAIPESIWQQAVELADRLKTMSH